MTRGTSTTGSCWRHERATLRSRTAFHPGPAARRDRVQGPPRRADHPAARRAGLRRRRARHPRPRHRRPRRPRAPVRHLRRNRVGHRVREGVQHRGPVVSPGGTGPGPARARSTGSRWPTTSCCGSCTTPATRARSPSAGTATSQLPGGKLSRTALPREEWISFIPGAHPGYITLDQYDANRARLAANAAAHGRDRAAGPPREGPALLQGIIICGTCGQRMTVRYHQRRDQQAPHLRLPARRHRTCPPDLPGRPRRRTRPADRAAAHRHPHPARHRSRPHRHRRAGAPRRPRPTPCAPPTSSAPATTPTWPAAATSPSTPPTGSSPAPSKPTGTPRSAP